MKHGILRNIIAGLGTGILAAGLFIGGWMAAGPAVRSVPVRDDRGGVLANPVADPRTAPDRPGTPGTMLQAFQDNSRQVASSVLPVVVRVDVLKKVAQTANPFQFYFNGRQFNGPQGQGNQEPQYQGGYGSGIIFRQDGETVYVLTNNHVVDDTDKYTVRTHDGKEFEARLVGTDNNRDIAVISFPSKDKMPIATLGDSSRVQAGDIVYAVGSPYGIQNTITQGIVSAVNRQSSDLPQASDTVSSFTDYLQTDAAINPGNSGGALVDINGAVIGVNTWIATRTGENVGLGFAVPINNAAKVAMDFVTKGKVEYGWLGVTPGGIVESGRESMGIKGKDGAFIYNLIKGSPADKAGILPGDLVTRVDARNIKNADELVRVIAGLDSNKDVKLTLLRKGREMTLTVRLGLRDDSVKADTYWPGFTAFPLSEDMKRRVDTPIPVGTMVVMSVEEGTVAADAGLRPGDEIVSVNDRKVDSMSGFYDAINTGARKINMVIRRNGREITLSWQG